MAAETNEIEVVTLGQDTVQTTNARNLHAKLEISKDFSDWIKAQIARADLEEGVDYLKVHLNDDLLPNQEQQTASNTDSPKKGGLFGGDRASQVSNPKIQNSGPFAL